MSLLRSTELAAPPPEAAGSNEYLQRVLSEGVLRGGAPGHQDDWPPYPMDGDRQELDWWYGRSHARLRLVREYSWAIPNDAALDLLAGLSPLVEMGAGGGYWAMLLRERGADILPYDRTPYPLLNGYVTRAWVPVTRGGPSKLRRHPNRTLFVCWPSYNERWAAECLRAYRGRTVVYVGEGDGGCTADDHFHDLLAREFYTDEDEWVTIPRWWGMNDHLEVWHRREGQ